MISFMIRLPQTLLLCLVTLLTLHNQAQAKAPDWYQIEVVIFAQQASSQGVTEIWRDTFNRDYSSTPLILGKTSKGIQVIGDTERDIEEGAFVLLPDSQRELMSAAQRIKNSADLRLLSHLAWRQPVLERDQAQAILIQTGEKFNDEFELEGTLTISRSRYLHARTDLFFSRFEQMQSAQALDWTVFSEDDLNFGQREWNPSFNDVDETSTQFVRAITANLKQSRRMRSSELHYIDHPLFGLLVQITPYKLPDPAMDLKAIPLQSLPAKRPLPDSAISPNL